MGDYFTKHHQPHHNKEIWATYIYMENVILKLNHMVVQERSNAILKINHTVLQGCANGVHTYGQKKFPTVR